MQTVFKALEEKDAAIRFRAVQMLTLSGSAALPLLRIAMKDENAETRREATVLYLRVEEPERVPVPLLIDTLRDDDRRLRCQSCTVLRRLALKDHAIAGPAIPALTKALKDKDLQVQSMAANVLVCLNEQNPDILAVLVAAANDEHLSLDACWALEKLGPNAKDGVPLLVKLLEHQDENVSARVATVLGRIGPAAVPALIKVLEARNDGPALFATSALFQMGPKSKDAVPVLILRLKDLRLRDQDRRHFAAETLGRIGPDAKAAVPALIQMAQDNGYTAYARVAAKQAVKRIDSETAKKAGFP